MEDSKNACPGTPNPSHGARLDGKDLDAMSAVELAEEMERVWGEMDEDTYDESVINAYLEALDRKAPVPDHPDAQAAYERFLELTGASGHSKPKRRAHGGVLRAAIAAVVTLAVVFGAMITAQAAGLDVFGRIARWTKETFSFGNGTVLDTDDVMKGNEEKIVSDIAKHGANDLSEFQNALDSCGITSVKAPSWMPDGYILEDVSIMNLRDFDLLSISSEFEDLSESRPNIVIGVLKNSSAYPVQVQNDSEVVGSYFFNNIEIYLVENKQNITITWTVDDFEYRVSGDNVEQIKLIAESMIM